MNSRKILILAAMSILSTSCEAPKMDKAPVKPAALAALAKPKAPIKPKSLTSASTVSLAWDLSPDTAVAGYRLYWGGASRTYTNMVDVGNTNVASVPLSASKTFFAATDYATNGLESAYSLEVTYDVPAQVLTVSAEWASDLAGPWAPVPGFVPLLVTNPTGQAFFRLSIK